MLLVLSFIVHLKLFTNYKVRNIKIYKINHIGNKNHVNFYDILLQLRFSFCDHMKQNTAIIFVRKSVDPEYKTREIIFFFLEMKKAQYF